MSTICAGHKLLEVGPSTAAWTAHQACTLQRICFPSPSSRQLSVAPHVGMGLHATVSLHAGIMSGLAFTGLMPAVTHMFIVSPVFRLLLELQ